MVQKAGEGTPIVQEKSRAAVESLVAKNQHHTVENGFFQFFIASVWDAYNEREISLLRQEKYKEDNGCYPEDGLR